MTELLFSKPRRRSSLKDEDLPLLRGWVHGVGTLGAIAFTIVLVRAYFEPATADPVGSIPFLVYGVALIVLFGVSATYHLGDGYWSPKTSKVLKILDHSTIFVFIAGTFTPITTVVEGVWGPIMLGTIWLLGVTGVVLTVSPWKMPRAVKASLYVIMGWMGMALFPLLTGRLPWPALGLMLSGGLLYTLGAVFYALKRPNPIPGIFGFHEVFHLLVVAGCASFAAVVYAWVLPIALAA